VHNIAGVIRHHTDHAIMMYESFSSIGISAIVVTVATMQLHYSL